MSNPFRINRKKDKQAPYTVVKHSVHYKVHEGSLTNSQKQSLSLLESANREAYDKHMHVCNQMTTVFKNAAIQNMPVGTKIKWWIPKPFCIHEGIIKGLDEKGNFFIVEETVQQGLQKPQMWKVLVTLACHLDDKTPTSGFD